MDATNVVEDPTEDRPECPKLYPENCAASIDYKDSSKVSNEMNDLGNKASREGLPQDGIGTPGKETPHRSKDQSEESYVIESSPEKPSSDEAKDESIQSPSEQVFSNDEEEEHKNAISEEVVEHEEGEEEEEEEEEEDYDEMDEDEEIYVETTDRTIANELSDENSSLVDISSDEYTDDEAAQLKLASPEAGKDDRPSTDNLQNDDDEDVQILTDDDDDEDEDEEQEMSELDEMEEVEEAEEDMDEMHSLERVTVGKPGQKSDLNSSGSSIEKSPRQRIKYRNYQHKLTAMLRKRSCKIINKRSMHVMEDSSDALVVCSDANLTTNLKPALASPKEVAEDAPSAVEKPCTPAEHPEPTDKTCVSTTTDSQNNTKEIYSVEPVEAANKREAKQDTKPEEAREKSSNAISSTTANNTPSDKKMPTATAIEVSEKIADSSDDTLAVFSSQKSISAATTPTVNSSASTDPGEAKAKKSNPDSATAAEAPPNKVRSHEEKHEKDIVSQENSAKSPATVDDNEPTAEDIMDGIDDFIDHNGSETKEQSPEDETDFNEDLTFQMDVDEPVTGNVIVEEKIKDKPVVKGSEESAMDLRSTSEQQQQPKKDQSENEKELFLNVTITHTEAEPEPDEDDKSPEKNNQRSLSGAVALNEGEINLLDKTVATSTPLPAVPEKVLQKQMERAREEDMQVKQEVDDAGTLSDDPVEDGAQNLSTHKPLARSSTVHQEPREESSETNPPVSRKRRRSIEEEGGQEGIEPEEGIEPAKKLKVDVEANYQAHERVVKEYIEKTPNKSVNEIQRHTDVLVKEIQALNDMISETETKWNNLLHLKKVKEEILLRLNRRKHVMGITDTRLGEVSVFNHLDSSNLSSQQQQNQTRSYSAGPRPPTPPPEVEIRPASVSTTTCYSHIASNGVNPTCSKYAGGQNHDSLISSRRNSSNTCGKRGASAKDTSSFVSQFNSNNNAVTMVPLPSTTTMSQHARASMNAADLAKEKTTGMHIHRQLLPKPVLSNQQQIMNNLAMSAGQTSRASASGAGNNGTSATVGSFDLQTLQATLLANNNFLAGITSQPLLNGHHGPSVSSASSAATTREQRHQQQLQIGRQGMRKDVSSIIADYRQKHPENVPRRGRRLKHVGGSGSSNNNGGMTATSTGNSIGTFGEGGAVSLTALSGAARPSSTDSVANRISELLAAAENSRPSSNDSSQSSSNLLSSLMSPSNATSSVSSQQQFLKDVLVQFAKMSQNEQSLLSNLQLLANNAVHSSSGPTTSTTNTVSSPQQSPQFQQQQQQSMLQHQSGLLSKTSLPEVTLHPVMNSTAHSDVLLSHNANSSLAGTNLSAANSSSNSLLHGILTKSASRPSSGAAAAAAAFNSFSPTLARLLTGPERMNAQSSASSSTVTSGALANLHTANVIGGLNLSKNNSEISITPVVGSNFQQTLLAQQQQQHLQRLREQHLFKGDSYLNIDDEADDSVDRLVIDEGDDLAQRDTTSKRRGAEINENEVPQCQGCKKMEARFVCAGCASQWYCSRACQVNAWDDHSEVCSG